jgi:hypothetical protein
VTLAHPSFTRAGGDFVDLAAGGSGVWLVGPPGVRKLDASTGRTLVSPALSHAAYPLSVALAGGTAWVASVENGYVGGALSRIDLRTGRVRRVWHAADAAMSYVAADGDGVCVLISSARQTWIASFNLNGRLMVRVRAPGAGRTAGDASGCWVSGGRWLLHVDPSGRVHRVVRAGLGDLATGDGAVWLREDRSVLRVDERNGSVRRLATGGIRAGGFQHDIAVGDGALWLLDDGARGQSRLVRIDLPSGRRASVVVPGIANAVAITPGAAWVASVIAPAARPATAYVVIRIDPRTLRSTRTIRIV